MCIQERAGESRSGLQETYGDLATELVTLFEQTAAETVAGFDPRSRRGTRERFAASPTG